MLNNLAEEKGKTAFVKGYEAEHCEALGLVLSNHFEWDGLRILEVMYAALEDSNFHTENEQVEQMINRLKERRPK